MDTTYLIRGELESEKFLRDFRNGVKALSLAVKALEAIAEESDLSGCLAKTTLEQIQSLMQGPYMPLRDELDAALGEGRR